VYCSRVLLVSKPARCEALALEQPASLREKRTKQHSNHREERPAQLGAGALCMKRNQGHNEQATYPRSYTRDGKNFIRYEVRVLAIAVSTHTAKNPLLYEVRVPGLTELTHASSHMHHINQAPKQ